MPLMGERIRELRKKRGITAEAITKQLMTSSASIWRWESGKNQPSQLRLHQLAEILNTSVDYLMGRTDDPSPPKKEIGELSAFERQLIDAYRQGGDKGIFKLLLGDDK